MNKQGKNFQAFLGYWLDIYKLATFKFNNPHSYTKFCQIRSFQKTTKARVFIETGTYLGVTTKRCAPLFDRVYTIELDKKLSEQATQYLLNNKNTTVIQGDALEILPAVLADEEVKDVLVFLDGHFSGGVTACGINPEPAMEEIEILSKYKNKIECIIVDDFRSFGNEPGFPKKSELLKSIEYNFTDFDIKIHLDQLIAYKNEK